MNEQPLFDLPTTADAAPAIPHDALCDECGHWYMKHDVDVCTMCVKYQADNYRHAFSQRTLAGGARTKEEEWERYRASLQP